MKRNVLPLSLLMASAGVMSAGTVFDLPMTLSGSQATETVKGSKFNVQGNLGPMQINGADGNAWRTDGYTTSMTGQTGAVIDGNTMTAQVAFAIDTNAIIGHDDAGANNDWAKFVDCLNGNSGFAFMLGRSGQFAFRVYVGAQLVTVASDVDSADGKLQLWQWYNLAGVVNGNKVGLYLNGKLVKEQTVSGTGVRVNGTMTLGRDNDHNGLYALARQADFNGAIDYVRISDEAQAPSYTSAYADLNLPADRYKNDKLRAKYHGQPGMNWTNETHGILYNKADGKYHVIFQRTGSAPVMSHAHYGHIVSDDLFNWRDDKPMIWPSEDYDRRGCWSGCIFTDDQINGGKPTIIYTGVEYGSTSHANIAYCTDATNLRSWTKPNNENPITTYNNVARDTYFFRTDANNAYFIIGDEGCMKSYKYNNGKWNPNGNFYNFQAGESGFTEMPNVAKLPNGKWLMTYTPFTGNVQAIYRIGDIDSNGHFTNFSGSQLFDFFANDGFCLMSPSIGPDKDGNLVALGIVADKMATEWNIAQGYAHLYSLPRQLGTDAQGRLTQKPFSGHKAMRGSVSYKTTATETLDGTKALNPVRGRQAEVCATFTVGNASFGINFLKNAKGKGGSITYNPSTHTVSMDVANVVGKDYGMKNASYTLPVYPAAGEDFKMHLFIDHSIADLFINDRYATSFRVFPESMDYDLIEVFSNGATTLKALEAYMLGEGDCSAEAIMPKEFTLPANSGKVAFLKASAPSEQENAAMAFFTGKLKNNNVVAASEANKITKSSYDCVWIHIDRKGLPKGAENLPEEFRNQATVEALVKFVEAGGNIYLSGQATQLAVTLGRISPSFAPNEYAAGDGGDGNDEWTVNPKLADKYNHADHAIYADLEVSEAFGWTTYGLLWGGGSSIRREDHNCMWKLSDFSFTASGDDNVKKFENQNLASVLGTWGQERTDGWAGIVEFYPVKNGDAWSGTILANGLAACQWSVAGPGNAYAENLQLLTANAFSYLANKDGKKPYNPEGNYEQPEQPTPDDPAMGETLESTGKVGLYLGYASESDLLNGNAQYSRQDKAIYSLFTETFPEGTVIYTGDLSAISVSNLDALWVHCDRKGLNQGWRNLPAEFSNDAFVQKLKEFSAEGGNLYLSKQASQLTMAIGRTGHEPTEFAAGDGGYKDDCWQTNVRSNGIDHSDHLIFTGVEVKDCGYGKVVDLMSGGHVREDHNCMWKLNDFGGHDNFCSANNAKVLGTWGHDGGQAWGGLVEFMPQRAQNAPARAASQSAIDARKGTVIANGLAAFEFAPADGTNASEANLKTITSNIMTYLSPVKEEIPTGFSELTTAGDAEPVYFNLQGQRVANPAAGIYIEVRGNKSRKVIL